MTLLSTRKSTLRKNGIVRRRRLLDAARLLLQDRDLDEISLGDVAVEAKVPKGSAYHFYSDIKDLYVSLLADVEEELQTILKAPIRGQVGSWMRVVEILTERGMDYYAKNLASMKLQVGAKTPPDLKLHDRKSDVALGEIYEEQINAFFELPQIADRSTIFFRAIEIADLMFSLSVLEHGRITPEMEQEANRAMCAYLACYIPKKLPRQKNKRNTGK